MRIESAVVSDIGKRRSNNEDNYFLNGILREDVSEKHQQAAKKGRGRKFLFSVCDGMGGECHGEIASRCAAAAMEIFRRKEWSAKTLDEFLVKAEHQMQEQFPGEEGKGMGSTTVMLMLKENTAYVANLGDSRLYLFREGKLMQLSKDHTQAQLLVEHGLLQQQEAESHEGGHILTRYLGTDSGMSAEDFYQIEPFWLNKGDMFLLCSDGLTDMLADGEIAACMKKYRRRPAKKLAEALCEEALQAGGRDNVTCAVVRIKKLDREVDIDKLMEMFAVGM